METSFITGLMTGLLTGFTSGYVARKIMQADPQLESQLLKYLETNSTFTIGELLKDKSFHKGFFAKNKIRMATSSLLRNGQVDLEVLPSSNIFNRDSTMRFVRKTGP